VTHKKKKQQPSTLAMGKSSTPPVSALKSKDNAESLFPPLSKSVQKDQEILKPSVAGPSSSIVLMEPILKNASMMSGSLDEDSEDVASAMSSNSEELEPNDSREPAINDDRIAEIETTPIKEDIPQVPTPSIEVTALPKQGTSRRRPLKCR